MKFLASVLITVIFGSCVNYPNQNSKDSQINSTNYSKSDIEEFKLLNICHCVEYVEMRNLDYIKWEENGKEKFLNNTENQKFGRYISSKRYPVLFQSEYDSSKFFRKGISIYFEKQFNFTRLDSLYFEPIIQYYAEKLSNTEKLPYLGLGDFNAFFDCYYKVKEIPLEQELVLFLKKNHDVLNRK